MGSRGRKKNERRRAQGVGNREWGVGEEKKRRTKKEERK
jgi:hypothetical protein